MYTKIHWLHAYTSSARLGIMARPRGNEWLQQEIDQLKKQGIQVLVSLLEQEEITELGLKAQQAICAAQGIEYINFPIADRSTPTSKEKVISLVEQLIAALNNGCSVVIHCRMGIGRSSLLAGCILLKTGYKTSEIMPHISKLRGLKVPDTPEQEKWLTHAYNR